MTSTMKRAGDARACVAVLEAIAPAALAYDAWAYEPSLGYARALYVPAWRGGAGRLFADERALAAALAEGAADVLVADVPAAFHPCRPVPLPAACADAALEMAPRGELGPAAYGDLAAALAAWWARSGGEAAYEVDRGALVALPHGQRERVALDAQAAIYDRKVEAFGRDGRWPGDPVGPLPPVSAPRLM